MAATRMTPASMPIKVVEPKSLLERIQTIRTAIENRAYEIFQGNDGTGGRDLDDWFKAEEELLHPVHVNLAETDSDLLVEVEAPGFEAKDFEVSLDSRRLTISARRESRKEKKEKGTIIYEEQCSNEILRILDLPADVDAARTTATLKSGVLELKMPKIAGAKTQAAIKAA